MTARHHAIIIGGSIAGLWTARVLADHFERVTVIDRDHFPDTPEARKGVPQGRQLHVLLTRGQQILDQLFPGLCAELEPEGVTMIRWTEDSYSYGVNGHQAMPFDFGYQTMGCSRLLLEWHMRQRLQKNPKITFVEGRQVTGLLSDDAKTRVTGVRIEAVGGERASVGVATLDADLIVDASGRESRAPEWLTALGYEAPEETVIDAHVGYATRFYQRPPNLVLPWKTLLVQSRSGIQSRNALIYPIEHDQWIALMVGVNVDLPADNDAYLEFARNLPVSVAYDALKDAEPLSPIYRYQRMQNQKRSYGSLERLPEGFILVGDAVCAFNPVFGQGMSISAMEAILLDKELHRQKDVGLALRFQKQVAQMIKAPWQLATSEDARNAQKGEKVKLTTRLLKIYFGYLHGRIGRDETLAHAFFDVMHLLKPPTSLFYPPIFIRVLRAALTEPRPQKSPKAPQSVAESQ